MPRGTENAHTHAHPAHSGINVHVRLELKGIWMCVVIGAELGSMQWITHTPPAEQTHTHTHTHTNTGTEGGWEATSERSVPWWPWIFPCLSSARARLLRGVMQIPHAAAHTNTPTCLSQFIEKETEKRGGREMEREGRKRERECAHQEYKGEDLPLTQSPFLLSPPHWQRHSFPPVYH